MEEEDKAEPIELDAEKVNELLDVLTRTKDDNQLLPLSQAARTNLAIMAHEIQKLLAERAEEAKKKAEEESAKKAAADKAEADKVRQDAKEPEYGQRYSR